LNDLKASFSNYGGAADVAAPGEALISPYPGGFYALWSGTSASAALVSGEASLIWSKKLALVT
jgi:subtilisin family serine protease